MKPSLLVVLCILCLLPYVSSAQNLPQPILSYSRLPQYPPIAIATRMEGNVKLSFVLNESGEVIDVKAISGPPALATSAVEDVKSWRFSLPRDLYRTEWRYETEFVYRLSGQEVETGATPKLSVSVNSFHHIEVVSDAVKPTRVVDNSPK